MFEGNITNHLKYSFFLQFDRYRTGSLLSQQASSCVSCTVENRTLHVFHNLKAWLTNMFLTKTWKHVKFYRPQLYICTIKLCSNQIFKSVHVSRPSMFIQYDVLYKKTVLYLFPAGETREDNSLYRCVTVCLSVIPSSICSPIFFL